MSATIKADVYMLGMPISRAEVLSRVECQSVCIETPGCRFYNLRLDEESIQCHYSDPLHGIEYEQQPDGGIGWTAYSSN